METIFTNIKERVLQIPDFKSITKENFFNTIGVTYGNFKGKAKEKALSSDTLATIVAKYPEINPYWLLTGKGKMVVSTDSGLVSEPFAAYNVAKRGIPVIPYTALAGNNGFGISVMNAEIDQYIIIPMLNKQGDFAFKVEGDSMSPAIKNGSYVICKKIELSEFKYERVYLISVDHSPMIKRLLPSDPDTFLCRSDNPEHRDFIIQRSGVNQIAEIICTITL